MDKPPPVTTPAGQNDIEFDHSEMGEKGGVGVGEGRRSPSRGSQSTTRATQTTLATDVTATEGEGPRQRLPEGGELKRERSAVEDTEAALAAVDPGIEEERAVEALPNGGYGWVIVLCTLALNASTWGEL